MMRRQLDDARVAMTMEINEAKSLLDQRYKDGAAAGAAQAHMNQRSGRDEASALRAMQAHYEALIAQERLHVAEARALAEPNERLQEELATQNKRVALMTELLARERACREHLSAKQSAPSGVPNPASGVGTNGGVAGPAGMSMPISAPASGGTATASDATHVGG